MSLAGLDLNLLLVLDALLEECSVTGAARRIGLSPSATSHALARLRSRLGDPILVRAGGGMTPTSRARELATPVREALDRLERALAPPHPFDPGRSTRSFTLSLEDAGQVGLLPLLARRLADEAPGVALRVRPGAAEPATAGLGDGAVDLALTVSPEPRPGFHGEVVFTTPYVSILRRRHPAVGKRLTLARFTELGHVALLGPGSVDPEIDRALDARARARRVALAVPSLLPIPWLVARSDLVATVPALLLALDRGRPPLARHRPPLPLEPVTGSLVWHERAHHDPAQRWLRQILRDACRTLGARSAR